MKPTSFLVATVCCLLLVCASSEAQDTAPAGYRYVLPLRIATEAAQEAIRICEDKQYWVTATVVDMDGVVQVVMRGDNATVHTGESSKLLGPSVGKTSVRCRWGSFESSI
jgi:hypothetical protein